MERAWDRHNSWRELSPGEAERLVRRVFPRASVRELAPLPGGLRNTNYRLELDRGRSPLVLRFYDADPSGCVREAAVLGRIAGVVPAPEIVHADADAKPPLALLSWIEGEPFDIVLASEPDDAALRLATLAGTALASIHALRFPRSGFFDGTLQVVTPLPSWSATLSDLRAVEERLGPRLAAGVRAFVAAHGQEMDTLVGCVLCHGDYKPWNLLVGNSGDDVRLSGILDWEFAFAGPPLFDFATFLRDEAARPDGFGDAFADAYVASGGRLPSDWRRLTRLLDLINLMQLIEWGGPRQVADLVPLVEATVRAG